LTVVDVTDDSFAADVLQADLPVIVDFWAPWCRPCKTVGRVLGELVSEQSGRVQLAKLNVDENFAVSSRYGVLSLPTVILFTDGEPRETVVGPRSKQHFERVFEPHLGTG
jgi:thioredoxin 1